MPAHQRVRAWVAQNYQKPAIDQEWLADCSDWIASELGFDPNRDFGQFIQHVEAQLLQSNLADSTVHGSGIDSLLVASNPNQVPPRPSRARRPGQQAPRQRKTTGPTPLLVEIKSITEIAHSAFSLLNTHQTRLDRADLGLAQEDNAEEHDDEDEGPIPRFSRGMLRFELSDGTTTFRAIEFRPLPQLELGTTPLGYKILLISTPIRDGIAFLEPENVVLKGYRTEDHDVNREQVFLSSLRKRLGRPDPPLKALVAVQPQPNPPARPVPAQAAFQNQLPAPAQPPLPPDDDDDMYDVDPDVLRQMAMQMDEEITTRDQRRRPPPLARPPLSVNEKHAASSNPRQTLPKKPNTRTASSFLDGPSTSSKAKTSPYFNAHSADSDSIPDIGLSPRPVPAPNLRSDFDITWDSDAQESSKLPVTKSGSTSARTLLKSTVSPTRRLSSPDPYDDLSFDMDVDESYFEQLDMIEQDALSTDANTKAKGKGKDIKTEDYSRPSVAPTKKTPSDSVLGTKLLALSPLSPCGAEASTRARSSTERATSASSLNGSTESPMPQSTQSSARNRRLPCDPSFVIISSSEDEAPGGHSKGKPLDLARRHAKKPKLEQNVAVVDPDVIDISD